MLYAIYIHRLHCGATRLRRASSPVKVILQFSIIQSSHPLMSSIIKSCSHWFCSLWFCSFWLRSWWFGAVLPPLLVPPLDPRMAISTTKRVSYMGLGPSVRGPFLNRFLSIVVDQFWSLKWPSKWTPKYPTCVSTPHSVPKKLLIPRHYCWSDLFKINGPAYPWNLRKRDTINKLYIFKFIL